MRRKSIVTIISFTKDQVVLTNFKNHIVIIYTLRNGSTEKCVNQNIISTIALFMK